MITPYKNCDIMRFLFNKSMVFLKVQLYERNLKFQTCPGLLVEFMTEPRQSLKELPMSH